jgi:hypothetical protein
MDRTRVSSSNIASIGYDAGSRTLEIQFLDGSVYRYYDVPSDVHAGLMAAASHGSYLATYVKKRYRYEKV